MHSSGFTTISIAQPLQNRQHAQATYLGQIWHATVGQWYMLTGLMSSGSVHCVADAGKKTADILQFQQNCHIWAGPNGTTYK